MPSSFGVRLKSSLPSPSILPSLSFSLSLSLSFSLDRWPRSAPHLAVRACVRLRPWMRFVIQIEGIVISSWPVMPRSSQKTVSPGSSFRNALLDSSTPLLLFARSQTSIPFDQTNFPLCSLATQITEDSVDRDGDARSMTRKALLFSSKTRVYVRSNEKLAKISNSISGDSAAVDQDGSLKR